MQRDKDKFIFFCFSKMNFMQKLWLEGFAGDIQEVHKKSCTVLENAVRNIYTVVAFSAEKKVMEVYDRHLSNILMHSFMNGQLRGLAFGVSQFLLFACNAFLLWDAAEVVRIRETNRMKVLKQFIDRKPQIDSEDSLELRLPNDYGDLS